MEFSVESTFKVVSTWSACSRLIQMEATLKVDFIVFQQKRSDYSFYSCCIF